ncbi:MAG TPA: hypothetical protein VJN18_15325 [Polyangiaceae bacterium]|nr:hypothetical protein [Polyangiaceae bacterium]
MSYSNGFGLGSWLLMGALGCGSGPEHEVYFDPSEEQLQQRKIPTFEEYKSWAKPDGDGYIVEWDIPLKNEGELRAQYEALFGSDQPKSAVRLTRTSGSGSACPTLSSTCIEDKFYSGQQRDLKYCVDSDFGVLKSNVVAAMAAAAAAWKAPTAWADTSHVKLTYVSTHDSACKINSPLPSSVYFKVSRRTGLQDDWEACAFWPYSGRTCSGLDGRTIAFNDGLHTTSEYAKTLTHEVGHVLGMHHEHQRPDSGAPPSCVGAEMRYLSAFDPNSVMGYPFDPTSGCGFSPGDTVSEGDAIGIRALYGIPVPWHVPTSLWLLLN